MAGYKPGYDEALQKLWDMMDRLKGLPPGPERASLKHQINEQRKVVEKLRY